jgi:hypothetical protein
LCSWDGSGISLDLEGGYGQVFCMDVNKSVHFLKYSNCDSINSVKSPSLTACHVNTVKGDTTSAS